MMRKTKIHHGAGLSAVLFVASFLSLGMLVSGCANMAQPTSPGVFYGDNVSLTTGGRPIPKAAVIPPWGFIFTQYKAPLEYRLTHDDGVGTPIGSTGPSSTAEVIYINPWPLIPVSIAFGDTGVQEAARSSALNEVYYTDYEFMTVLGVFSNFKVHAYGSE